MRAPNIEPSDLQEQDLPDPLELILACEDQDEQEGVPQGTHLHEYLERYRSTH